LPNTKAKVDDFVERGTKEGGGVMKKCMITITEVLDNKPCQTMVLDISEDTIEVNCPENSGIEVESVNRGLHSELIFKLPNLDHELHFRCKNNHTTDIPSVAECDVALAVCTDAHLVQHLQVAA
jgi:hypothetical protein